MICCGSANVLSGVALIRGPRRDRPSGADHTVIDTGHHRLSIGRLLRDRQDEKRASIRMRKCRRMRDERRA